MSFHLKFDVQNMKNMVLTTDSNPRQPVTSRLVLCFELVPGLRAVRHQPVKSMLGVPEPATPPTRCARCGDMP